MYLHMAPSCFHVLAQQVEPATGVNDVLFHHICQCVPCKTPFAMQDLLRHGDAGVAAVQGLQQLGWLLCNRCRLLQHCLPFGQARVCMALPLAFAASVLVLHKGPDFLFQDVKP